METRIRINSVAGLLMVTLFAAIFTACDNAYLKNEADELREENYTSGEPQQPTYNAISSEDISLKFLSYNMPGINQYAGAVIDSDNFIPATSYRQRFDSIQSFYNEMSDVTTLRNYVGSSFLESEGEVISSFRIKDRLFSV
ncbi:MAG: hypothetical protein WBA74_12870, partial [Cyclobacteriaceae bacterium]